MVYWIILHIYMTGKPKLKNFRLAVLIYIYHFVNTEFGGDFMSVGYFTQYITIQHSIDKDDRQRSWQDIR